MIVEAVTVCVGYADFLAETMKHNLGLLDHWTIVTTESDKDTRKLCREHDVTVLLSNDHERNGGGFGGGVFNKGRMVERGLQHTSSGSWRLHIDSDIVLPSQFRRLLEGAHLDTKKIYGCDRIMVKSWDDWQRAKSSGAMSHAFSNIKMPKGFEVGDRWALHDTGYVPIGFFQLWHSDGDESIGQRFRKYPINHGDACRTDVQFALKWDRRDRELLPEIIVVHLESEPCKLGANWNGRTTKRFGKQECVVTKPCS